MTKIEKIMDKEFPGHFILQEVNYDENCFLVYFVYNNEEKIIDIKDDEFEFVEELV